MPRLSVRLHYLLDSGATATDHTSRTVVPRPAPSPTRACRTFSRPPSWRSVDAGFAGSQPVAYGRTATSRSTYARNSGAPAKIRAQLAAPAPHLPNEPTNRARSALSRQRTGPDQRRTLCRHLNRRRHDVDLRSQTSSPTPRTNDPSLNPAAGVSGPRQRYSAKGGWARQCQRGAPSRKSDRFR